MLLHLESRHVSFNYLIYQNSVLVGVGKVPVNEPVKVLVLASCIITLVTDFETLKVLFVGRVGMIHSNSDCISTG